MDVIQTSIERSPSGFHLRCKLCNNLLPLSATFCGECGNRVTLDHSDPLEPESVPEENAEQDYDGEMTIALHPRKSRQALDLQAKLTTRPLPAIQPEIPENVDETPTIRLPADTPRPPIVTEENTDQSLLPVPVSPVPTTPTLYQEEAAPSLTQRVRQALAQIFPSQLWQTKLASHAQPVQTMLQTQVLSRLPAVQARVSQTLVSLAPQAQIAAENATTLLKQVQRFVVGEQHPLTRAAALIETPLRIQPGQDYIIRLRLIGRSTPTKNLGGLSGLRQDEVVHIEVRSTLYTHYAYVLQHADVRLPGQGYAAEVKMPMPPFLKGTSGRRERLHIFFMDEQRRPLYEKPFAIELFVSPLVRPGSEGYHTLTIPL